MGRKHWGSLGQSLRSADEEVRKAEDVVRVTIAHTAMDVRIQQKIKKIFLKFINTVKKS